MNQSVNGRGVSIVSIETSVADLCLHMKCVYLWPSSEVSRPRQTVALLVPPPLVSFRLLWCSADTSVGPLAGASILLEQSSRRPEKMRWMKNGARAFTGVLTHTHTHTHTPSGPCLNRCSCLTPTQSHAETSYKRTYKHDTKRHAASTNK